jgi:transcriptional regulator with XRE-family HTH domain
MTLVEQEKSFADVRNRMRQKNEAQAQAQAAAHPAADPQEVLALRQRITGVLLRDARIAKGFSTEQVAVLMLVPPDAVTAWEFGQAVPSLPQLELLAYWLEVPVTHFLSGRSTLVGQLAKRQLDQQQYLMIRDHMIGAQLAQARHQANFTLEYLAERLGLEAAVLAQYEYGHIAVPLPQLVDLAALLKLPISAFLEGSDRVGAFIQAQELFQTFLTMNPEVREFIAAPANHAYLELAMKLAQMDTQKLRGIAEMMLEITL